MLERRPSLSGRHPEALARITDARQIIAFRNILAHGYDVVEDVIVWSFVEKRLPALLDDMRALMAEEPERP